MSATSLFSLFRAVKSTCVLSVKNLPRHTTLIRISPLLVTETHISLGGFPQMKLVSLLMRRKSGLWLCGAPLLSGIESVWLGRPRGYNSLTADSLVSCSPCLTNRLECLRNVWPPMEDLFFQFGRWGLIRQLKDFCRQRIMRLLIAWRDIYQSPLWCHQEHWCWLGLHLLNASCEVHYKWPQI